MWSIETATTESPQHGINRDSMLKNNDQKPTFSFERASRLVWRHFKESYTNKTVLIWSIWWSLCQAGFFLVINYVQLLWQEIDPKQESFYNGGVEALLTLFGALSATLAGHVLNKSFVRYDIYLLTLCSFVEGGLILISATTSSIYVSYIMYILFGILFHFIITLVTSFVAQYLSDDSFALIFGINTLVALLIQTIFTVVFVTETASLSFSPRQQFYVFGYYFIGLGVIYSIASIVKLVGNKNK
jgi:thiamine transporter 2/3